MSDDDRATLDTATAQAQRALLETLIRAHAQGASARELLALAPLQPEQRSALEMLMTLNDPPAAPTGRAIEQPVEPELVDEDDEEHERMLTELADLRRANDTLAAALGACPVCWGGNRRCRVCRGDGSPGYAVPDRKLFGELIMPAIARVREVQRPSSRMRQMRAHVQAPVCGGQR